MTVKERVITSHLIQKIKSQSNYAMKIGLSYRLVTAGPQTDSARPAHKIKEN